MTTPVLPAPATGQTTGSGRIPGTVAGGTYTFAQLQAKLPVGSPFAGGLAGEKVTSWHQNDNSSPVASAHGVMFFDTDKGGVYIVAADGGVTWTSGNVALPTDPSNPFTIPTPQNPLNAIGSIGQQITDAIKGLISKPFFVRIGEALIGVLILVIALAIFFKGQGITLPKVGP